MLLKTMVWGEYDMDYLEKLSKQMIEDDKFPLALCDECLLLPTCQKTCKPFEKLREHFFKDELEESDEWQFS